MGKKKKAVANAAKATNVASISKTTRRAAMAASKEERRARKLAIRKKEKKGYTAGMWAEPAPSHLVARLDIPRVKSKYQSYFEFAANPEKKDKKLEFKVTNDSDPPPGFVFVPIGDPILTNACKELSREKDAMIFIVSTQKEENSKISEHIHRTGYHFREVIVDEAREIVGETVVISQPARRYGKLEIEPIPESQEEINKQADAAIRDLFPRIPNIDRTMIIEHAFKKGAMFHGEPTVGLQTNIPLSRRVQLAVLAHIRHTHTRYDKLLRETTWMNARKVVEPVCLDVLVKWRGDEETGRDQMDEIIREVVIITDSEDEDDSSDDEDTSEEEGEVTSASSTEPISQPASRNQQRLPEPGQQGRRLINLTPEATGDQNMEGVISRTRAKPQKDKKAQRGFKRYQAAWEEALHRHQDPSHSAARADSGTPLEETTTRRPRSNVASPLHDSQRPMQEPRFIRAANLASDFARDDQARYYVDPMSTIKSAPYYSQRITAPGPSTHRSEVIVRPPAERIYYQETLPSLSSPSYLTREQRPSQVVRGSSATQVLKDLLVPSIEPITGDVALPRVAEPVAVHDSIDYSQDARPRRVIEHRPSPAPRPRTIINDDSPQIKRRRLIREDDAGHFRPLPSRDSSLHSTHDSYLMSTSSAHLGDFHVRHPRVSSQSTQGLYRDIQSSFIDPATSERLPVYDAPESGYSKAHPAYLTRLDDGPSSQQQQAPSMWQMGSPQPLRDSISDDVYSRRPTSVHNRSEILEMAERDVIHPRRPTNVQHSSETLEMVERDRRIRQVEPDYSRGSRFLRPLSPEFPMSNSISRSYGAGSSSVVPDQDFVHSFSQSRLDSHVSSVRDGFTILAERAPQSFVGQRNVQDREGHPVRSFATVPLVRARSPVRYVERPMYGHDDPRHANYYEHSQPIPREYYVPHERLGIDPGERRLPPSGEAPTYVRTLEPRRHVIVLE